jgi:hypothetical protein
MEREAQRPNSSLQQLAKHRRREGPEPGAGGRLSRGEEKGGRGKERSYHAVADLTENSWGGEAAK